MFLMPKILAASVQSPVISKEIVLGYTPRRCVAGLAMALASAPTGTRSEVYRVLVGSMIGSSPPDRSRSTATAQYGRCVVGASCGIGLCANWALQ